MEMRHEFEVRLPVEAAFGYLSDPNRAMELLDPRFRVEWEGSMAVGATFHLVAPNPKDHFDGVVEEFDQPRRVAYRLWSSIEPARGGTVQMDFAPTASGTRVVGITTTTLKGTAENVAQRLMRPALVILFRRGTKKLIRAIESAYQASRSSQ
jgi:carbon monoxide dehydrogenase subunit G